MRYLKIAVLVLTKRKQFSQYGNRKNARSLNAGRGENAFEHGSRAKTALVGIRKEAATKPDSKTEIRETAGQSYLNSC
jgi:hypothetical protein